MGRLVLLFVSVNVTDVFLVLVVIMLRIPNIGTNLTIFNPI